MKGKFIAFIALIILIFLCTSGLVEPITKVFIWLITLDFSSPEISIFGQLVVKYGTWLITFALVKIVFDSLGWFNSTAMKIVYAILSMVFSFLLSWIIMILENYLLVIAIVVGVLLIVVLGVFIICFVHSKKKNEEAK